MPSLREMLRADESAVLTEIAAHIAASIRSPSDPRLDVANAIARQLKLDWFEKWIGERDGWAWRSASESSPGTTDRWECVLAPWLTYVVTETRNAEGWAFRAEVVSNAATAALGELPNPVEAREACYRHFDASCFAKDIPH